MDEDVYIARRECGCIVAARVDSANRSTARDVAQFIRWGLRVERVTLETFRAMHLGCEHQKRKGNPAQKRMAI